MTRWNRLGITDSTTNLSSYGAFCFRTQWKTGLYSTELLMGYGDNPRIMFRGNNGSTLSTAKYLLQSGDNDPIKSTATSTTLKGNGSSRFFYFTKSTTSKASIDSGY